MLEIGELSRQTGVAIKTIRYYEEIGLLAPASRGENRYRLYDPKEIERLRFIRSARAWDFRSKRLRRSSRRGIARNPHAIM